MAKYLPHSHEDLSSGAQHPFKPFVVTQACDYCDEEMEAGGSLHLAKPTSLGEVRSKEEEMVRKGKGCKRKNVFSKRKSPEK